MSNDQSLHFCDRAAKGFGLVFAAAMLFAWSALLLPRTAHAYVDPGSGSVIVTAILGMIAAVGYTFRKYFYKARNLLLRKAADRK